MRPFLGWGSMGKLRDHPSPTCLTLTRFSLLPIVYRINGFVEPLCIKCAVSVFDNRRVDIQF